MENVTPANRPSLTFLAALAHELNDPDGLREWIQAHLHTPITPTDLTRRSSCCQRSLQDLFQQRFGCSPMQGVNQQRLDAVHRDLQRAQPGETGAAIACCHGFGQTSSWSASFQQSCGVAPSVLQRPCLCPRPAYEDNRREHRRQEIGPSPGARRYRQASLRRARAESSNPPCHADVHLLLPGGRGPHLPGPEPDRHDHR